MSARHAYGQRLAHAAGWTEERVALLKKLWAEGKSAGEIAKVLGEGVSRNGVIGKVNRLGLPPHSDYVKRSNHRAARLHNPARAKAPAPRTAGRIAMTPAVAPTYTGTPQAPTPIFDANEPPGRCTMATLGADMCRWPIGDPHADGFTFCGAALDANRPANAVPYCTPHRARAFQPARPKASANDLARALRRYV